VSIYEAPCTGGIDLNGAVDAADLSAVLASWFFVGKNLREDLSGDLVVDAADLAILRTSWGECP
jgi:hypothetical protein